MKVLDGFRHLPGHLDGTAQRRLLKSILAAIDDAPLFTPTMPRTGKPMSVRMSNCGPLGWVTDKERGYRYQPLHPSTGRPWPAIPDALLALWIDVCGAGVQPEACLINWYSADAKLGLHRDEDEQDCTAPVLSVSLGADARFVIGGLARRDAKQRIVLRSGDVVVLGGQSRLAYHGVERILPAPNGLMGDGERLNLTLRRVSRPG